MQNNYQFITGKIIFAGNKKLYFYNMAKLRNIGTLTLNGGMLCFNFINTIYAWRGENLHEYLGTYDDVVAWCKKVNILTHSQRAAIAKEVKLHPAKAVAALNQLHFTRGLLYQLFSAIAAGHQHKLPATVLAPFNKALSLSYSHLAFSVKQKKITLAWVDADTDLLQPLWMIMKDAADILTTQNSGRIKECPKCGWVFIDSTKNNMRRWCSPLSCGSTDKAKKYYDKIREKK